MQYKNVLFGVVLMIGRKRVFSQTAFSPTIKQKIENENHNRERFFTDFQQKCDRKLSRVAAHLAKFSAAGATQKISLKEPLGNRIGTFCATNRSAKKRRLRRQK